jgi:hypothetical protein
MPFRKHLSSFENPKGEVCRAKFISHNYDAFYNAPLLVLLWMKIAKKSCLDDNDLCSYGSNEHRIVAMNSPSEAIKKI